MDDRFIEIGKDWLFQNSLDAIFLTVPDGRILAANPAACSMLGRSEDEICRIGRSGVLDPTDPRLPASLAERERTGRTRAELTFVRADGTRFPGEMTSAVFRDSEGNPRTAMIVRDISERNRLAQEREQYFRFFMLANDPLCIADPFGCFKHVNPAFVKLTGYTDAELVSKPFLDFVVPEDRQKTADEMKLQVAVRPSMQFENRYLCKDGRQVLLSWTAYFDKRDGVTYATAHDITELKRAEESLQRRSEELEFEKTSAEKANQAKDHFLAVLSHELRTPLTPVLTAVELLQRRLGLNAGTRELEIIRRNVQLQARLIDDLLDLTRIAQGKLELRRKLVNISTVIERAVEIARPDIDARRLHFGVTLRDAPLWVEADASRLQQVVWNLLSNAVKFTPEGGCVELRCEREDGRVLIEVSDSGIGIEPDAAERIFDAFEQGGRAITRQFGGLGLGLAIAKRLVEIHEGTISVHSEGRNRGSTFRIHLPLSSAPAAKEPQHAAPAGGRSRRILLVEDNGDSALMMKMLLESFGYQVEVAADVKQGLEAIDSAGFDLLISDLGLPDGSGIELMQELRRRGHAIKGIAVSGYGQPEDLRRSKEAGFSAHLIKPVDADALMETVAATV